MAGGEPILPTEAYPSNVDVTATEASVVNETPEELAINYDTATLEGMWSETIDALGTLNPDILVMRHELRKNVIKQGKLQQRASRLHEAIRIRLQDQS